MAHHILAVYTNPSDASIATDRIVAIGVPQTAISAVVSEGYRAEHLGVEASNKGAAGAATGATIGGILGGIAGALAATGVVAATGGAVLVAGPIAAALAGVGAGGASGGILGGLIGLGVPDNHVKSYESAINNGSGIVLGVECDENNKNQVKDIMKKTGGKSISVE